MVDSKVYLAWQSWAALVADRANHERRACAVIAALARRVEGEALRFQAAKLDALGEFAGGAGHELNNPLAVIVGRAQLLLARSEDPETTRSLRIILSQAGRAHRILRDLMFVARPSAPRPRSFRPADLLKACVRDLQEECAVRGLRIVTEIEESGPVTAFDPDALRHVADILLRNAIQASPSGGEIRVQAVVNDAELCWSFDDAGRGIIAHEASHLFDPFFCGRQAGRGLGLGLPRAARIVESAGGSLRWTTKPGQGSTFRVHLPRNSAPQPHVTRAAADLSRPSAK